MAIEDKIITWSRERGIFSHSTPLKQAKKAKEEIYELIDELFYARSVTRSGLATCWLDK